MNRVKAEDRGQKTEDRGYTNIEYRTGQIDDCGRLAEFVDIASDGAVEFLFHDLIPNQKNAQSFAGLIHYSTY